MLRDPFDPQGNIITSLLDTDFYKFTMGQVAFKRFPDVPVTYSLIVRNPETRLGQWIKEADLRRELDAVRKLSFNSSELHFLKGTFEYGRRLPGVEDVMFAQDYIDFLAKMELPSYKLIYNDNGTITLEFSGPWSTAIYWETPAMAVISELYLRAQMAKMSRLEREAVWAASVTRLAAKTDKLKRNPHVCVAEAGARRRQSQTWQAYEVERLSQELTPTQMRGTSNVWLAMKYGLLPMGTFAHEQYLVMQGLMHNSDDHIRRSHNATLRMWFEEYGEPLSVALGDTYGRKFFFHDFTDEQVRTWRGVRGDSGDLFTFGHAYAKRCRDAGVDPGTKLFVPSDGLDVNTAIEMSNTFRGTFKTVSNMIGTHFSFDNGIIAPLSMAVKVTKSNGHDVGKLSDNRAKATGKPEVVARLIEIFDNHDEFTKQPEC